MSSPQLSPPNPSRVPHELTATEACQRLQEGSLSVQTLVQDCLNTIKAREPEIHAWQHLAIDAAWRQAEALPPGDRRMPLFGIPVGVKDIVATADMPTEWGTPIYRGRRFTEDAAVVERLRDAGAIILGKTVTTEYASGKSAATTNPWNLAHTPGASSSGSAAAVAAGMVPVAIATQSVGSILRPAAYCGIWGFKPSFGTVSRTGVMPVNRDIDHVGLMARSVEDLARVGSVLVAHDDRDPDGWQNRIDSLQPHLSPRVALVRGPFWTQVEPEAQQVIVQQAEAISQAGGEILEIYLPAEFDAYPQHIDALVTAGLAVNHGEDLEAHGEMMSSKLRSLIEQGRSSPLAYAQARHAASRYHQYFAELFTRVDAILTPVTSGTAPQGLENTGSPIFCALWTLCGLPALSIPITTAANGLPLAVQLVGWRGQDSKLLNTAAWIAQRANADS